MAPQEAASAAAAAGERLRAWFASHRVGCACRPIELRQEGLHLECAACGARIVNRPRQDAPA
jgi:DNA-directed RNA polymerase subunit RPC12/RpoP